MAELSDLMNIGKEMERKLRAVGINTAEELREVGSKEAFVRLKTLYPSVCAVFLYTLEGAISDIPYNHLPEDVKAELQEFSRQFGFR
ncbi:MAG: TfoX/Sxy family protein [Oscillospiraceae bacterium]|nr:TfoX/Sxy family protein [Oscillospiraceae bacterium]